MRVTVAGTSAASEPTWPTSNNGTVVSGGVTFVNTTGQSAYGWSAAAGDIPTLLGAVGTNRFQGGDRMFVSSDHSETQTTSTTFGSGSGTSSYNVGQVLSVNRAGSVPPVAADLTPGATATCSNATMQLDVRFPVYHYGMIYVYTATSSQGINFQGGGSKHAVFDSCQLYLNTSNAAIFGTTSTIGVTLNNTTVRFGAVTQSIQGSSSFTFDFIWMNTPSAIAGATLSTALFFPAASTGTMNATVRGVDLSALTTTLVHNNGGAGNKFLFDSCRIAAGVTRYNASSVNNTRDLVELINCYDGTNIINESYQPAGVLTTERTITLSGGATDDVGTFSHKLVSNVNVDKYVNPLAGFWMDIEHQAVGSSKTATVEIISSASLNNDEISLLLEYQGTASSPAASFGSSLPATVLTTAGAVTTSTATWNSSPATPVKQKLEVTFTPQLAGRVRGQVRLGKASATVYVNPVITIT